MKSPIQKPMPTPVTIERDGDTTTITVKEVRQ